MDAGLARIAMLLGTAENSSRSALAGLRRQSDNGGAAHDLVCTAIDSLMEARKKLRESGDTSAEG